MNYHIETINSTERRITIEIPNERIEPVIETRLHESAGRVHVKGFRRGKIPFAVIKQRFGDKVRREVIRENRESCFREIVDSETFNLAGEPCFLADHVEGENGITVTATFDVYPQIDVVLPDNLLDSVPRVIVGDPDIDAMIETLRRQAADWKDAPAGQTAGPNDCVKINFRGFMNGKPLAKWKATDLTITPGDGLYIGSIGKRLVGAKPGEQPDFKITIPDDYPTIALRGAAVDLQIVVRAVLQPVLPAVDDAFMADFDITGGGIERFREELCKTMEREVELKIRETVRHRIMEQLLSVNDVPVPESLLDHEIRRYEKRYRAELQEQGKSGLLVKLGKTPPDHYHQEARDRIAFGILVKELARRNHLDIEPGQLHDEVKKFAAEYEDPEAAEQTIYREPGRLAEVEALVLEGRVIAWLRELGKVNEVETTFDELMATKED